MQCGAGTRPRLMHDLRDNVAIPWRWVCHCHGPRFTVVGSWVASKEMPYIGKTATFTKTWTKTARTSTGKQFSATDARTLLQSQTASRADTDTDTRRPELGW